MYPHPGERLRIPQRSDHHFHSQVIAFRRRTGTARGPAHQSHRPRRSRRRLRWAGLRSHPALPRRAARERAPVPSQPARSLRRRRDVLKSPAAPASAHDLPTPVRPPTGAQGRNLSTPRPPGSAQSPRCWRTSAPKAPTMTGHCETASLRSMGNTLTKSATTLRGIATPLSWRASRWRTRALSMRKVREILRLRHAAGLSGRAIARSLRLSPVTVKSLHPSRRGGGLSLAAAGVARRCAARAAAAPGGAADAGRDPVPDPGLGGGSPRASPQGGHPRAAVAGVQARRIPGGCSTAGSASCTGPGRRSSTW